MKQWERLNSVHRLSSEINGNDKSAHEEKLLAFMREHIEEIEALRAKGDPHFLTETGDLVILCLELLLENGIGPEESLEKCLTRFENKLMFLKNKQEK